MQFVKVSALVFRCVCTSKPCLSYCLWTNIFASLCLERNTPDCSTSMVFMRQTTSKKVRSLQLRCFAGQYLMRSTHIIMGKVLLQFCVQCYRSLLESKSIVSFHFISNGKTSPGVVQKARPDSISCMPDAKREQIQRMQQQGPCFYMAYAPPKLFP